MLHIFLLKRDIPKNHGSEYFDTTHGFVVAAMNEVEARIFAASYREVVKDYRRRDESPEVWLDTQTSCTRIGVAEKHVTPGVILEDHQWG